LPKPLNSLRTAVAGVSGYAGGELVRLLLDHPHLADTPPLLLGRSGAENIALTSLQPQLSGLPHADSLSVLPFDWKLLKEEGIDLLFLATPHEQSREDVPHALANGLRVVDLSGAWRLHCEKNRAIYNLTDADPAAAAKLQSEAVYGSPELHGPQIAAARLVANPGCYATSIILALAPLLQAHLIDLDHGIVCDAKSGVSGAGKAPTANTHFMYAADNLSAYAVFGHRHTGEMLEQLNLTTDQLQFTPHLLPIPRGILSTIYLRLNDARQHQHHQSCIRQLLRELAARPRAPLTGSTADSARRPHQLLRPRLPARARRQTTRRRLLPGQSIKRCGLTGRAKHEPHGPLRRNGRPPMNRSVFPLRTLASFAPFAFAVVVVSVKEPS
jgi:N-acetyl-gamma-glutamyl-phosphate reductase